MPIEQNIETRPYRCAMFLMDKTTESLVRLEAGDVVAFKYKANKMELSRNGIELALLSQAVPIQGAPHIELSIGLGRLTIDSFPAARSFCYIIAGLFGFTLDTIEEDEGGCSFQFTTG